MRSEAWHGIRSRRSRQARCHPSRSTAGASGSARSSRVHAGHFYTPRFVEQQKKKTAGENKQTLTHLRSSCHRWISGNLRCTSTRRSPGCSRRSGHTGGPGSASTRLHLRGQRKKKKKKKSERHCIFYLFVYFFYVFAPVRASARVRSRSAPLLRT